MERIRPKKSMGQNFLTDRTVLARIVSVVDPGPDDAILEVGPGQGALTGLMADRVGHLVAVELDRQLVPLLQRQFADRPQVEIVQADILRLSLAELLPPRHAGRWKVAANLPYNISSQVLFLFLDNLPLLSSLVLMLQKEVGDRLAAAPGSKTYGMISVFFQLHFQITREFVVKPGSFHPVPKVDSVVLKFEPLPAPRADVGDEPFFRRVVRASFSQRRKTLWNCLRSAQLVADDTVLRDLLDRCGIDAGRRAETLTLEEFALLARTLHTVAL
jgi:16S rRNA (adenine1518-N6/adenine1519-N6)-dimethyltransferase